MSSPSAILWFAAVGGALIARQGSDLVSASTFLAGFVAAGVVWSISLCALAHQGGRFMGERMLRWSYIASALIFAYFTLYVVITGYTGLSLPLQRCQRTRLPPHWNGIGRPG